MSTTTTIAPPAVKKRGRPKKVIAEDAGTIQVEGKKTTVKKPSAKAAVTKEKVAEKKAPAQTKTVAKNDVQKPIPTVPQATPEITKKDVVAPKVAATVQQPTPAAPTTSKIMEEVRATGAFKSTETTTTAPTTSNTPHQKPQPSSIQHPPTSSTQPPLLHSSPAQSSKQRATTIPLPRAPLRAPSPKSPYPAPRPHTTPAPGALRQRTRIIEPTPDMRLPPKYRPAARRVTAIIVGIPIILVFGWELYGRWKGEVRKKWGDGNAERS